MSKFNELLTTMKPLRFAHCVGMVIFATYLITGPIISLGQQALWTGLGGDNLWGNPANWLIDGTYQSVPGEGTNVIIDPGYLQILYTSPMPAPSIGTIDAQSPLLIGAPGFVVAGSGDAAIFRGSGTVVVITNQGEMSVPNGNLIISNVASLVIWPDALLTVGGDLDIGGHGQSGNTLGSLTNFGGNIIATATRINPRNLSYNARVLILGGSNFLGNVEIRRSQPSGGFGAIGTEGLVVSNGTVITTSLDIGGPNGNSFLSMIVAGGNVTNTGNLQIRQVTANRTSRFLQLGGLFQHNGPPAVLCGHTQNNTIVYYSVLGGTNLITGFYLGRPEDVTGRTYITNAGTLYIGPNGVQTGGTLAGLAFVLTGGVLGALADWESTVPLTLNGGIIKAADLENNPHNITLNGGITGSGKLIKMGTGTLIIGGPANYTGDTLILEGTVALTGSSTLGAAGIVLVEQGTTLDCSSIGTLALGIGRTLMGRGTIIGNIQAASGSCINPGTDGTNGTLNIQGTMTISGGAILTFDLANATNPINDAIVLSGDLVLDGANTLLVNGTAPAHSVIPIIQYGGSLLGALSSLTLSGVTGYISNNLSAKTLYLVVTAAGREPATVRWVGNPANNVWDVDTSTNWLLNGQLEKFLNGDTAVFDDLGLANSVVQIPGPVLPAKVVVDTADNYEFTGAGAISGTTTELIKTNSGKLTINTTNTYGGATKIAGGVLSVSWIANGNQPSPIGQSTADPQNLQLLGGKLQYTGGAIAIDRGMTLGPQNGQIEVVNSNATLTLDGLLTGEGGLVVEGTGTLRLNNAGNSYAGPTTVKGTLQVTQAGSASTNTVVLDGGVLYITLPADGNFPNNIHVARESTIRSGTANNRINGAISGSCKLNVEIPSGTVLTFNGDLTNFTGTFYLGTSTGSFRFNSAGSAAGDTCLGCPNATIDLGEGSATLLARNPNTIVVGALKGGANTRVTGPGSGTGTLTWVIGSNTNEPSTVFEGTITDSTSSRLAALVKIGPGKLTLTGDSTYTGPTEVREGTLEINGSLGATMVTVYGGATLTGNGTFGGPINVWGGGILSPGNGLGQMTCLNNLTLDYGSVLWIEVDKTTGQYDSLSSLGWVTFGGITLVVSNLGGAFLPGDTFKVIQAGENMITAYVNEIIPATPGPGLQWDLSTFSVDGTIRITGTLTQAPRVWVTLSGNNLELNVYDGLPNAKYYILASTNPALPISAWTRIATNYLDSQGKAITILPITTNPPQRFYLISMPIGE